MKLYVVRHGEAIERSSGVRDEDRWLTAAGREKFRSNAIRFSRQGISPDCILTSPLVRAVQTADILAEVLSYGGEIRVCGELRPGFDLAGFHRVMDTCRGARSVVIVGHEPDLGELVGRLLGAEAPIPLRKGVIMALRLSADDGTSKASFRWLIHRGRRFRDFTT